MMDETRTCARGFTFVEVLIAMVILGLSAVAVGSVYTSGVQALDMQNVDVRLDSALRSKMEYLLAFDWSQLTGGNETVTVRGVDYTLEWAVSLVDVSGDAVPDPYAKRLTVTLRDKVLVTIVCDDSGKVSKF